MSCVLQKLEDVCGNTDDSVVDSPKPSEPDEQVEQESHHLLANSKLWLGKDYSNFIKKDWVQLDRPFEGTSSYSENFPQYHTRKHTE